MAVTATTTRGFTFTDTTPLTPSNLNSLGTPVVDITGAVGTLSLDDGSVTNAKVSSTAAIDFSKLATLSSGNVLVGNGSGAAASVAMSGDATISSTGALTLASSAVTTAKLADSSGSTDGVTTAKIADDAVTADKLADTAVTAAVYTNASITVDDQGRITNASSGSAAADKQVQTSYYTDTGSSTFTVPAGVTKVRAKAWGGGGGYYSYSDGNGGGGAYCEKIWTVTAGEDMTVVVGAKGGNNQYDGDADASTVTYDSVTMTAGGGNRSQSGKGTAGAASGGDINIIGKDGTSAQGQSEFGGGGREPRTGETAANAGARDGAVILEYIS